MVPGHPPCALCSLIFFVFILRPIVLTCPNLQFRSNPLLRLSEFALLLPLQLLPFLPRPSRVCNWPFFLNLLRCAVVKVRFALSSDQTLKTIQSFKRVLSFSESYAVVHFRAFFCVNFVFCRTLHVSISSPYRPQVRRPCFHFRCLPRKEVIQPHLPIRLPCYDFTPVIGLALGG